MRRRKSDVVLHTRTRCRAINYHKSKGGNMLATRVSAGMALATLTITTAAPVWAQDFPTRPIRIVTSAAGGGNDVTARLMSQWLSGPLGQQVIVENRTSQLAAENVAKALPDGYTLIF